MSTILVEEPGLSSTIQDLGRPGYGPIGVSACGAADAVALRLGNRLVGNAEGAPAIEMTLRGGRFVFPEGGVVAITGGVFDCSVPLWRTHRVEAGGRVSIGGSHSGARCYLCVRGGIDVPRVLGSASTHVVSRLGGVGGLPLRRGHRLSVGGDVAGTPWSRVRRGALEALAARKVLRVTRGPQAGVLPDAEYEVLPNSNRTGIRLNGVPVESQCGSMITEGVSLGAVQAPSNGQPIILFVDAQTTGGYPVIANVIAADLASLGQLRPRDRVRFEFVSFEEARTLYLHQEELLRSDCLLW